VKSVDDLRDPSTRLTHSGRQSLSSVDNPPSPSTSPFVPASAADLLLRFLSAGRHPSPVTRHPSPASRQPLAVSREPTAVWPDIVVLAASHCLAPLLFKRLKDIEAWACVPADAWERLRLAYFVSAGRNGRLYRRLEPVLRCLRSHDIPVIVLKGAYLAEAVYGDVALRQMCDADLMVPKADLPKAHAVLLDMGRSHQQSADIDRRRLHLPPVVIRDLVVELHWTIASPTGPVRVDAAGLWDRARPVTIAGVEVLALSPEDLLLHLCLHFGYQHHLAGLKSFCDVAETIHHFRGKMDWQQVVERAREWGATRYVGLTLHLARSMMDAAVPDEVLAQLVPGDIDQRILETAKESVLARTGYGPWVSLFHLRGARSAGDKARLFWKRVFLSRREMVAAYPASRESKHLWFYYALRLRDVVRTFWSYMLRRGLPMIRSRGQNRNVALVKWLRARER
jgi:hypothetical protein